MHFSYTLSAFKAMLLKVVVQAGESWDVLTFSQSASAFWVRISFIDNECKVLWAEAETCYLDQHL